MKDDADKETYNRVKSLRKESKVVQTKKQS